MRRYLIVAQSAKTAAALDAWRDLLGFPARYGPGSCPDPIVYDPSTPPSDELAEVYRGLVKRIDALAYETEDAATSNELVILVDSIQPANLSAVAEEWSWENLVALLILAFPEASWHFGVILPVSGPAVEPTDPQFPASEHGLMSLAAQPQRDPLFDPTGLREWVRARTNADLTHGAEDSRRRLTHGPFKLPVRRWLAAAIDEEFDYASFHGYAAYRYGFRADQITTWALMRSRFGPPSDCSRSTHGYQLILEDMRLAFPDKPLGKHLSQLTIRGTEDNCPLLANTIDGSRWRFLITTGQDRSAGNIVAENMDYLRKKTTGRGDVLFKPVGGIAELWAKTRLYEDLNEGSRPGNAKGYDWPPAEVWDDLYDGHGTPGKLTMAAAALIGRSMACLRAAITPTDYIRSAVMATDALELLGGKTPTLTLVALSVKHESETRAECRFIGAGVDISLARRVSELKDEAASVARWFHGDIRRQARDEAMVAVLNRMVLSFREVGQVEEEDFCLAGLRRVNRRLRKPRRKRGYHPLDPRTWLAWLAHWILLYSEWLMASFDRVLFAMIFWVVAVTLVTYSLSGGELLIPFAKTVNWTFGGSTEGDDRGNINSLEVALSCVSAISGAFHFGILISYLYSLIARK